MIQTQQQAVKPNKTSTRQNLKCVSHLWLQTKNQISTLRINPDRRFDMPLVEINLPSTRHYFSQTQNSCFMPPIWTGPQSSTNLKEDQQHFATKETKVPLDENQSGNRHFLAETPLTNTIASFFPKLIRPGPTFPLLESDIDRRDGLVE